MYEAMARRYRPRTFDDVVGQEHVAQTLKNAITANRVAHAYLFCGPHGCGKTSMARIFACSLVCENGPTQEPCGKCPICIDVLRGQDVDVQEIDGASNNGVEQVRALREQAGYIPTRARFKVYIIDEVHMLSVAAFNALLKTLEEPPAHVKFILATTDPHKILGTILSRCQRFDFRLVPPPRLAEFFKTLVAKENAEITDDALDAVAAFSGGSVRDGLVLLDQLLSYAQGKVTREDVERVRGVASAEAVAGIYEAILAHDVKRSLQIVDAVARRGTNVGDFLDQLIEYGRDILLVTGTGATEGITAYGPARKVLFDIAGAITLDHALLMLDVFAQARTRVRSRALTNPLVPLEMAVARLAGLENLQSLSELVRRLDAYAHGAPLPPLAPVAPVAPIAPVAQAAQPAPSAQPAPVVNVQPQAQIPPAAPVPAAIPAPAAPSRLTEEIPAAPQPAAAVAAAAEPTRPAAVSAPAERPADLAPWEETPARAAVAPASAPQATAPAPVEQSPDEPEYGEPEDEDDAEYLSGANPAGGAVEKKTAETPAGVSGYDMGGFVPAFSANAAHCEKELREIWKKITDIMAGISPAENTLLADVYLEKIEQGALFLSVPGQGSFIFEQLEDKHRKARIAQCAQKVMGRDFEVRLSIRAPLNPQRTAADQTADRQKAGREPGVRLLMQKFEGEITNIEDDH